MEDNTKMGLKKQDVRTWAGLTWPSTGKSGRQLWTQYNYWISYDMEYLL